MIVGRNNTGKTTLLDLIDYAAKPRSMADRGHRRQSPQVVVSWINTVEFIDGWLPSQRGSVRLDSSSWDLEPQQWSRQNLLDRTATWELQDKSRMSLIGLDFDRSRENNRRFMAELQHISRIFTATAERKNFNPFQGYNVRRLTAERDVVPETKTDSLSLAPNGAGFTNIVERYINKTGLNRDLIEIELLSELNAIFEPDAHYTRLVVQQLGDDKGEIYLDEPHKGLVPMSQTGSGLKTVLLVLGNLLLIPAIENASGLSAYFFCFEELENHLHPAIQRRLFRYLRKKAVEGKCHIFITTHSNVVIDLFSRDDAAQLLHVTHNGEFASVSQVTTSGHGWLVLDDLDVRASDLLQTTAVVWVEGPSDRIYFNRWIELWSNGELQEGVHFQCLPYGGSVGSHFSFETPDIANELIAALRINRHAILLADSDKREEADELKAHLARLKTEVENADGYAWITKGKEVENYIPAAAFPMLLDKPSLEGPEQYTDVLKYIADRKGNKTPPRKTELAHEVTKLLTKKMVASAYDLAEQLEKVCQMIRKWNRLPGPRSK